ncbi:MAG: hypothetical protein E7147_04005 [Rikenellaceae bacterium]|nr:hypothetical protein [Rikenellaceae bacterium]
MKRILLLLSALLCVAGAEAQKKAPIVHLTCPESSVRRTEIILPTVKGFNCYKADFHIHTSYSDGVVTPAGRVDEAWYDGLDIIAITDHLESHSGVKRFLKVSAPYNKSGKPTRYLVPGSTKMPKSGIDPGLKVDFNAIHEEAVKHNQRKGYNLLLIKGCEMARNNEKLGHYNTLFVEDLNSLYAFELKEAFLNVKKQGGIIIHNHPGNVDKYENEWHADVYSSGLIDGVEVANGIRFYPYMVRRCVDNKLTMFGNTDTHGLINHKYSTIGTFRTMTIVLAKECTEKAVKDAILKRRTIAYSGGDLIGEEKWLAEFLNAAVDCRMVSENEKKGTRKYALTNMSSITYRLRRGRITYELEPFKTTFVDFGKDKETGKYRLPKLRAENMWIADYKHPTIELSLDK